MSNEKEMIQKTKTLIDDLKSICSLNGIGNSPSEYKVISQIFLYKYLNDQFIYEVKRVSKKFTQKTPVKEVEMFLNRMEPKDYQLLLMRMNPNVAKIKKEYMISYLYNNQNVTEPEFYTLFDIALLGISNDNIDIFSVRTGSKEKIKLFDNLSQYITETDKKNSFFRAIINKLVGFSFEEAFQEKYDFFATIFEYLVKDYNKDFGKYAEYYTPNSIAKIIARILSPNPTRNVTLYDPAAGSGTLLLTLAHQIGEENCTIYSQDISQKSNEFLRLNLILNHLVHSLGNVIHGDTLLTPAHLNMEKNRLAKFRYIVSNPPFKTDFSETRDQLDSDKFSDRFFAGVPKIPKKDKDKMSIYLLFFQHILYSLEDKGKAAIVVPSGFLTDTGDIHTKIRSKIIEDKSLYAVVQMPTNVFANTNTSVSIIFLDQEEKHESIVFVDASHLGKQEKISDNTRVVLSEKDQNKIVDTVLKKKEIHEFSKVVSNNDVVLNDGLLKPGLYFDMNYFDLVHFKMDMEESRKKFLQKQRGLITEFSESYSRNLFISKFIEFDGQTLHKNTLYGKIPNHFELVELETLIEDTIGGDWGKEEEYKNYDQKVYCIRGTDIPSIRLYDYSSLPIRYCKEEAIELKRLKPYDIVLEISGGSPIQSTGRMCYITEELISDLEYPVICTNFCRIIRLKNPLLARYVYDYLSLLYDRKYFFNLENNTTGIKNLILKSFVKNIKVVIPKDLSIIEEYYQEIDRYMDDTIHKLWQDNR